jgi:hypothetical protein
VLLVDEACRLQQRMRGQIRRRRAERHDAHPDFTARELLGHLQQEGQPLSSPVLADETQAQGIERRRLGGSRDVAVTKIRARKNDVNLR